MSTGTPAGGGAGDAPAAGEDVRVLVVDDQTAIREALATVLDLQPGLRVVATAADGAQAVTAVAGHHPDVVLMDLTMPVMDGVEATREILAAAPQTAVVVLTTFADDASILAALGAGARGYLTKDSGRADIARAVRAAAAGQAVLDPEVQRRLVASAAAAVATPPAAGETVAQSTIAPDTVAPDTVAPGSVAAGTVVPRGSAPDVELTPRELEVLTLIGEGMSNRAIATHLVVSEATVKTHINNLFAKAQLPDRAGAVRYAIGRGLVRAPG